MRPEGPVPRARSAKGMRYADSEGSAPGSGDSLGKLPSNGHVQRAAGVRECLAELAAQGVRSRSDGSPLD